MFRCYNGGTQDLVRKLAGRDATTVLQSMPHCLQLPRLTADCVGILEMPSCTPLVIIY